ncbi:stress-induced receptor-like kinase A1du [Hordeum vulgare]|nr:stress-induced receptor-like kinase A1du [Hordeum vulgare]
MATWEWKAYIILTPLCWYLGIWFNKIPVFTVVWLANREKPIPQSNINSTKLKFSRDNNLLVVTNRADANLALLTNSKVMMWQSFNYPTDITLSGAKLGWNKVTGFSGKFISRKSPIDMGLGSYSLELDTSGVAILKRCNNPSIVYWHSDSSKTSSLNVLPALKAIIDVDPRTKGPMNPIYVDNDQEEYTTCTLRRKNHRLPCLSH